MVLRGTCSPSNNKPKLFFVRKLFAVLMFSCSFLYTSAQNQVRWPLEVGFNFSGISYTGDYSEGNSSLSRVYPGANLSLQSSYPRALKLQMNAGFGKFAEQYDTSSPNIPPGVEIPSFIETSFIYGDLRLKYHFLHRGNFQPYLSAGAGVMFFNPTDQDGRKLIRRTNTRLEGEDFNNIVPELPVTAGVQFHLTRQVWMNASYTYRYTPTDYLDNVGLAGENNGFDALHSVQLGIHITLGAKPNISALANNASAYSTPTDHTPSTTELATAEGDSLMSHQRIANPDTNSGLNSDMDPGMNSDETQEEVKERPPVETFEEREAKRLAKEAREAIENEDFFYYRVKKGQTYESLGKKFYITPEKIKEINFLKKSKIKAGDFIRMPNISLP